VSRRERAARSAGIEGPGFLWNSPTWPAGVARPGPERRVGLDYDHDWSRRYPVRLVRAVLLDNVTRPLTRAVAPATVRGLDRLRHTDGPLIFAANHASHSDTALLLTTLPARLRHRTVVAAAADTFFDRTWKAALWSLALAAIPIDRTRVNRRSADTAAELLDEGWNLVIFPEGGRTADGWAQPFRGGAAYLSERTGCPVVPVYLHGTRRVFPKRDDDPTAASGIENDRRRLRRSPVAVLFGDPMTAREGEDARRFGVRVEQAITLLGDEVVTDWWRARRRAAGDEPPTLRGPEASSWRRAWALGPSPADDRPVSHGRWPR
jgi:1-acyl-sn-glycerol-3-phosphate acyltransferase